MTEEAKITPPGDDVKIRCPRLGHQIQFSYCRSENNGAPCFKSLDCWHAHFDVVDYFKAEMSEAQWRQAFEKPTTPKMLSLLELIEQAKQAKER